MMKYQATVLHLICTLHTQGTGMPRIPVVGWFLVWRCGFGESSYVRAHAIWFIGIPSPAVSGWHSSISPEELSQIRGFSGTCTNGRLFSFFLPHFDILVHFISPPISAETTVTRIADKHWKSNKHLWFSDNFCYEMKMKWEQIGCQTPPHTNPKLRYTNLILSLYLNDRK